jgi:hypothetical protein
LWYGLFDGENDDDDDDDGVDVIAFSWVADFWLVKEDFRGDRAVVVLLLTSRLWSLVVVRVLLGLFTRLVPNDRDFFNAVLLSAPLSTGQSVSAETHLDKIGAGR